MVRRWCGRRSRGAELLEKGAAPPEGAGGGVRGARTHKSGALPADAGASRRGPPRRTGGHRGGRRPLGSATPARRVHASIGAGSPPSHRGWAAGGPYGVRRGRMPRPAKVTPDSGRPSRGPTGAVGWPSAADSTTDGEIGWRAALAAACPRCPPRGPRRSAAARPGRRGVTCYDQTDASRGLERENGGDLLRGRGPGRRSRPGRAERGQAYCTGWALFSSGGGQTPPGFRTLAAKPRTPGRRRSIILKIRPRQDANFRYERVRGALSLKEIHPNPAEIPAWQSTSAPHTVVGVLRPARPEGCNVLRPN